MPFRGVPGLGLAAFLGGTQLQQDFVASLLTLLGDTRLLWLPFVGDTTTATDKSLNARTITWDATVAARLSALGLGYAQSFSGSAQFGTVPDADSLSFGSGAADSAFTVMALINVTDSAANKRILTKDDASAAREWDFMIQSNETIQLNIRDQSATVAATRTSNAALTTSVWRLVAATYSAAVGGAVAADDITIYVNGAVAASTATNNVAYVAMENLTQGVALGALSVAGATPFLGSMAMIALCQTNLSASNHWAIYQLVRSYFGI
jgi:hypothetical protein